ncbi:MAG: MFS transporter [Candidatus Thorarchaeota archaeon]
MSYFTDIFRGIHLSVINLYIATFAMRFAAYLSIGLISYMVDATPRAFIIMFYSIMEILTVSFFGVVSDSKGRKPVLIISHLLTTIGVILFMVVAVIQHPNVIGLNSTNEILFMLLLYLPIMGILGAGAASKVASTLTMIADESDITTRAQYMGFFDLATLGGFGVGLAAGQILGKAKVYLPLAFFIGVIIVAISLFMVIFLVRETINPAIKAEHHEYKSNEMLTRVITVIKENKDLQKILPVYIPIISLYGLLVAFGKELLDSVQIDLNLVLVGGVIAFGMGLSMLISGKMSDRSLIRRPFIIVGLICLAILLILLRYYPSIGLDPFSEMAKIWPIIFILSWGVGMFPPAILAYLTDISKKDTRGTMFGVYSVIFGSGMIIGPFIGSVFSELGKAFNQEVWGIVLAVIILVVLSIIGTLTISERAKESSVNDDRTGESVSKSDLNDTTTESSK